MDEVREHRKKILLDKIGEEERLIRIYEADLMQTRLQIPVTSLKRMTTDDQSEYDQTGNDVLTDMLMPSMLDKRWHDNPILYRILPLVSGIVFESAIPIRSTIVELEQQGSFLIQGYTSNCPEVKIQFHMNLSMDLTSDPFLSKVAMQIQNKYKEEEELNDIICLLEEKRNIPLALRQMTKWTEFHRRRNEALRKFQNQSDGKLERLSTSKFRILWSQESFFIMKWGWHVSWATSGQDKIHVLHCQIPRSSTHEMIDASAIVLSNNLDQLLKCVGGDCERALDLILKACSLPR
jgi:hypothetical protein